MGSNPTMQLIQEGGYVLKNEKLETKKVCDYLKSLNIFYFAIPSVVFDPRRGGIPIGYKKGMPDLCIPRFKLFLEMKTVNPSKVKEHEEIQSKVHEVLKKEGCHVYRTEGFEKAKEVIDSFF